MERQSFSSSFVVFVIEKEYEGRGDTMIILKNTRHPKYSQNILKY